MFFLGAAFKGRHGCNLNLPYQGIEFSLMVRFRRRCRQKFSENLLNSVINKAGLKKQGWMVCYNSWNERERETVKTVLGDELQTVDLTPVIGFAPSSSPLYNLTAALKSGLVGKMNTKIILQRFCSLRGMSCVGYWKFSEVKEKIFLYGSRYQFTDREEESNNR